MVYANAFRNVLRRLTELFARSTDNCERMHVRPFSDVNTLKARQEVIETLHDLDFASYGLRHALLDFIGVAYDRKLISSLYRLSRTLRKVSSVPFIKLAMLNYGTRHRLTQYYKQTGEYFG